ncbi:MAG: RagB/SusD family nutrient uptake outer membrane protein [Bacteroidales bacterium]|nr:RagB/SusD family nutrient uptake outer membrane protein [Bacteroidales bacterium]MCF8389186.1 RagB/SusD family nutrient uptake outer membrane protein [Bacteroidales bacterium]
MNSRIILIIAGLMLMGIWSCEEYLDKVEASDITEEDVFGTYITFQGFADQMYDLVVAYNNQTNNCSYNYGDHVVANASGMPAYQWDVGNYWAWYTNSKTIFTGGDNEDEGLWSGSWKGIRIANLCLKNIDYLSEATDEERDLLMGQAYFFRAFFHWEIVRAFGGMPYIDMVLEPSDNMKLERLSYHESTERIVEDLDKAIALLPKDWDETETGGQTIGANRGRATLGSAMGIKAKALLFAASPLMNNESTGSGFVYNTELLEQTVETAHKFLKLADEGYYALEPLSTYNNIFYTLDGTVPWRTEIIWQRVQWIGKTGYSGYKNQGPGRLFMGGRLGQVQNCEAPTENLIELFEMHSSGLPISEGDAGFDPAHPWDGRDPRFYKTILTDSTRWVKTLPVSDPKAYLQLYNGGLDRGAQGSLTGYMVKKFWPYGVNSVDADWQKFMFRCPILRLADIYLIYAEAANELYGPTAVPTINGETGMTAVEAVNIVRTRAEMPDVDSRFTTDKETFSERIRVERSIEFCFEGHRWHDLRRWHIGHLPEYKTLYGLDFNKEHTSFSKTKILDRVFIEKHYWMPLKRDEVLLYEGYYQNPGW